MVVGECLLVHHNRLTSKSSFGSYLACVYKAVGTFIFGAAMSQSLTDIAKYTIGRLRPHFLDVCKPEWKLINCSLGAYIENFTCTGDPKIVNEGRYVIECISHLHLGFSVSDKAVKHDLNFCTRYSWSDFVWMFCIDVQGLLSNVMLRVSDYLSFTKDRLA